LRVQLELSLAAGSSLLEIRRALVRSILVELINRDSPNLSAGEHFTDSPDWLVDGIAAHTGIATHESGAASLPRNGIFSLENLLRTESSSLDGPSRSRYRAGSILLVDRVIHLNDGRHRLAHFISDLPAAINDEPAHFRKHFPELFQNEIPLYAPNLVETNQLLPDESSERMLNELLNRGIPGASGRVYQLEDLPKLVRDRSVRPALVQLGLSLRNLRSQANPLYRQIIQEYERIVELLLRGKTNGITKHLAGLRRSRAMLHVQMGKINDFMNWFEATQAHAPSGRFDDYMKAAELLESRVERRRDCISVYLDVLEAEFEKDRNSRQ